MLDAETDLPDGEIEVARIDSSLTCDRLLFVVTDTELEQLELAASDRGLPFHQRDTDLLGRYYDLGVVGRSRVFAVQTCEGALGYQGSAARAIHWKNATGARSIVSVGMAFGVDRATQKLGDVLLSTHLLPYDLRTVESKDRLPLTKYEKVQARPADRVMLKVMDQEYQRTEESGTRTFRVHRGALLSGAARIHCRAYRDHLLAALSSRSKAIVGGEMEGVGLLGVAERAVWVVVKGIIDFADESRNDEYKTCRENACRNAGCFVLDALLHEAPNALEEGGSRS